MKSTYLWISFDLGLKGDYQSLYTWLDDHEARECGDSIAFINEFAYKTDIYEEVKNDITKKIEFKSTDRIYVISKNEDGLFQGRFIVGNRKKESPWSGYGSFNNGDIVKDGSE